MIRAGLVLRDFVNKKTFPWLQISHSSRRMAGAMDMTAGAQLPKIRDKKRKEKVRRNNNNGLAISYVSTSDGIGLRTSEITPETE